MAHFTLDTSQALGPRLNALITVTNQRGQALKDAGLTVPSAVPVVAMVDTGASSTCVDPSVLNQLGLSPTGSVPVHTPSSGATPAMKDQFDFGLVIPGADRSHAPLILGAIPVLSAELVATQGFEVLIGRDILQNCVLVYNGYAQFFTLAF